MGISPFSRPDPLESLGSAQAQERLQRAGDGSMRNKLLEPLELSQGETFLELDHPAGHERTGIHLPIDGLKAVATGRAWQ